MRLTNALQTAALVTIGAAAAPAQAQSTYLNGANISVSVGAGTSPGTFNNTFSGGATIDKVIDAPSAAAPEFHNQQTHIWYTASNPGGGLELLFDFGTPYDISTLHFWNYDGEGFDVDQVAFTFFNASHQEVGSRVIAPALGSSPAIYAQDIPLAAPLSVRYVSAFLTGSNQQVDFQNIGFTAVASAVPEPEALALLLAGMASVGSVGARRLSKPAGVAR